MNPQPLRGVLYGHGHMGRLHASKLASRTDIGLDIIDPGQGLTPHISNTPDFAVIATPTTTHGDLALPLLEKGVPCLVEKPLSSSLDEAEHLAAFSNLFVGHIERFNPVFDAVQGVQPGFVDIERLAPPSSRSSDVDVIDDLMIHDLDLLLNRFPGTIREVRATGIGVLTTQPDIVNARIELDTRSGQRITINITASRVSEKQVRTWRMIENQSYWRLDLRNRSARQVDWSDGNPNARTVAVPSWDPLTREHTAFFDAVRGNSNFIARGTDAVAALRLGDRIRSCLR